MYKLKKLLIFLFLLIIIFCISNFFIFVFGDEIWNYGFAYNISRGLVPYRDFNMIVPPLYSFVLSLFITIFGHHFIVMSFLNSFILTLLLFISFKKIKYNMYFIFPIFLLLYINGYNLLSVFWVILLLTIFDSNVNNKCILMGLIVGLLILTKQTVGLCVFLPLFLFSNNKVKFFLGVFLPLFLFLIFLVYNDALYYFIDYCFLGMLDFAGDNNYLGFLPLEFLIIFLLLYFLITKKVDKSGWIVLMFQIIVFPIVDVNHFLLGLSVFLFYLLYKFRVNIFLKSLFCLVGCIILVMLFDLPVLVTDKKSFLYGASFSDLSVLKYTNKKYSSLHSKYDNLFLFTDLAYVIKLNNNVVLNKFDLINDGNMGFNGEKRYIKEIDNKCKKERCYFMLDKHYVDIANGKRKMPSTNQTCLKIIKYVDDNYDLVESDYGFNYYKN